MSTKTAVSVNAIVEHLLAEGCHKATLSQINFDEIEAMLPNDHPFSSEYTVTVIAGYPTKFVLCQLGVAEEIVEFGHSDNPQLSELLGEIDAHLGQ